MQTATDSKKPSAVEVFTFFNTIWGKYWLKCGVPISIKSVLIFEHDTLFLLALAQILSQSAFMYTMTN